MKLPIFFLNGYKTRSYFKQSRPPLPYINSEREIPATDRQHTTSVCETSCQSQGSTGTRLYKSVFEQIFCQLMGATYASAQYSGCPFTDQKLTRLANILRRAGSLQITTNSRHSANVYPVFTQPSFWEKNNRTIRVGGKVWGGIFRNCNYRR